MLSDIISWLSVICALVGVFCSFKIKALNLKILIFYLIFSVIADFVIQYYSNSSGVVNRLIYCIFFPIEYWIYTKIFKEYFKKNLFLNISVLLLVLFSLSQLIFNLNEKTAATDVFSLMGILCIILSLAYFQAILNSNQIVVLSKDYFFWIATALLFFYTGNVIATGFYHRL